MDDFEDDDDYYDMDEDDDDYDGEDDFDFDDYDRDGDSNYSGSDVPSEESILVKPEYFETTELRFHSFTQSPCGAFDKNSFMHLKWYGFDKNAKFVYGILFAETSVSEFLQIVKFCPVTSGFYFVKRFDGKLYRAIGFDETSGTFFIVKSGTAPTIVLYNAASDFEACYRVKNGGDILATLDGLEALSCIGRQEWILFSCFEQFFQRVIFDDDETSVSLINFPADMTVVEQVFIYDKDTAIFVDNWNKIMVYNLDNGQFSVEDFTVDGITEDRPRHSHYWLRNLNVKGVRDFYVSSYRYGILKLDFPAKKWRCVNFSFFVDFSLGDFSNLLNRENFIERFAIYDSNCTLIGEPENGCFYALFSEISTKPVVDKKRNKNGKKRKSKRKSEDKIAQIVCCLPSAWSFSLQDLCLSKLFGEFRKNKGPEKFTDVEFCNQIGISPDLIQKYIGFSGV